MSDEEHTVRVVPTVAERIVAVREERRAAEIVPTLLVPDQETPEETQARLKRNASDLATKSYENLALSLRHLSVYDGPRARKYAKLRQDLGEFSDMLERDV